MARHEQPSEKLKDFRLLSKSISESRRIFAETIWPLWASRLNAEKLLSTEDSEHRLEKAADFSGTDGFFVRNDTGILIPIASRIEYFDEKTNNPFSKRFWDHYPRFTVRLAKRRSDGSLNTNVECQKRIAALNDPISRRYLPLYTFQSLVKINPSGCKVIQSSFVSTEHLFGFIADKNWHSLDQGFPSFTKRERDIYRIITVEKLRLAGIQVNSVDARLA